MSFFVKNLGGLAVCLLTLVASAAFAASADTLQDRLQPVGELCMAGENCASQPATQVVSASSQTADASGAGRSGEEIYNTKCATCHATGAAGAPKPGDFANWAPRLEKGIETLYQSAINGYNGMPAKGLCFDCTNEELKTSVDYMVENAK